MVVFQTDGLNCCLITTLPLACRLVEDTGAGVLERGATNVVLLDLCSP
jgi:hypothetical protein